MRIAWPFCLLLAFLSACAPPAPLDPALLGGAPWRVSYFWDKDKDETSDFAGFAFTFEADGDFIVQQPGGGGFFGTWSQYSDDGFPRLEIRLTGNQDLEELSDDWIVVSSSDSLIELRDDNDTELEKLHFARP